MKKTILALAAMFMTILAVQGQQTAAETIFEHIKTEGYVPVFDEDGDIKLKIEGRICFVRVEEDLDNLLYISMFCNIWSDDIEPGKAVVAVNTINSNSKMVTISYEVDDEGDIIYHMDLATVVSSAEEYTRLFKRIASLLSSITSKLEAELYH